MIRLLLSFIVLACSGDAMAQNSDRQPKLVTFQSGNETLNAYLWVPGGDGPFRAIVWNYGHGQPLLEQGSPSKFNQLADFYLAKNYVFCVPDRTGGELPVVKGQRKKRNPTAEGETEDIIAAVSWVRQQSYVDASKVAVSGVMSGAVQSMLAVERDATIRAAVVFSPAVYTWDQEPEVQTMLERAIDSSPVPIFLTQPQNDVNLGPSEVLGRKLARKAGLNRAKIYAPVEDTKTFAVSGMQVWGKDVHEFLDAAMK